MKMIKCFCQRDILVDDSDYERLLPFRWHCSEGKVRTTVMHPVQVEINITHFVLKNDKSVIVDHENLDGHDNRKFNLRVATKSQNAANSKKRSDNTSGYKGVSYDKRRNKWSSDIQANGIRIHLGRFNQ